jgi:hypothetical protein
VPIVPKMQHTKVLFAQVSNSASKSRQEKVDSYSNHGDVAPSITVKRKESYEKPMVLVRRCAGGNKRSGSGQTTDRRR